MKTPRTDLNALWTDMSAPRTDMDAPRTEMNALWADMKAPRTDLNALRTDNRRFSGPTIVSAPDRQ